MAADIPIEKASAFVSIFFELNKFPIKITKLLPIVSCVKYNENDILEKKSIIKLLLFKYRIIIQVTNDATVCDMPMLINIYINSDKISR